MSSMQPFSRSHSCRVSDALTYCGFRLVVLENEWLRVVVLPEKGAEIYALVYKPLDMDVLFKRGQLQQPGAYPAALANSETGFIQSYYGGWQEIFPSGGNACRLGDIDFGTHGEVFLLPWRWQVLENSAERVSVRFQVRTMQMPFLLERILSLEAGSAVLRLEETLVNESAEPLPFMWGHHPAFGAPFLDGSCVLDAPAGKVEVHGGAAVATQRLVPGSCGSWPRLPAQGGQMVDLRRIPPPESRAYDMFYLTELAGGWAALTSRRHGFGVGLVWDPAVFPVLWVWQELCGSSGYPWYGNTYALGLEPFTAYSTGPGSGLAEAVRLGRARTLAGGSRLQTTLLFLCYAAGVGQGVDRIDTAGRVTFRDDTG